MDHQLTPLPVQNGSMTDDDDTLRDFLSNYGSTYHSSHQEVVRLGGEIRSQKLVKEGFSENQARVRFGGTHLLLVLLFCTGAFDICVWGRGA